MAGETLITLVGNVVAIPELRYVNNGTPVANFTVASTARTYDKASGEWKDSEPLFMRCNVWREMAENASESLDKGTRVIVTGFLKQRSWEKDGVKRSVVELEVEDVATSLKFATAKVIRGERKQSSSGGQWNSAPKADPWGSDDDIPF